MDLKKLIDLRNFSLRKLNSILILIVLLILIDHGGSSILYLLGLINHSPNFVIMGRRLFIVLSIHVIISLYLFLKDKIKQRKIRTIPEAKRSPRQEILTGIAIVVLVLLHVRNYSAAPVNGIYVFSILFNHYVVDNLLFIAIALHLRVAFPRLLMSFGFLTGKNDFKKAQRTINILLCILFIIGILAETIFYIL
ncbi:hypothetical protein [Methanosphaera sp. WGK6]|uniref:hypothetical protein n=1 Tax=Methanosphaera sp. WGK6 TaxID=1561964 RepID=UPI00084CA174|nr:hypothetical protein [Methanosphaera sp. WGK6]OED30026.1 hypothetical protein NL43_04705 [Methanosphaera sp. WGK6]